jgi:glycosyltransferase involved in cell wall biosynthesis
MKIGIIWKNDYPWDVRVEKIARSLRAGGHDVCILSANAQGRAGCETLDGLHIRRLPATPSRWLNAVISTPFYLNPFWFRLAYEVVRREQIDLVIVRDLPLVLVGVWLKSRFRIPLILDMAEDYPAMYRESLDVGGWRAWIYRIVKNPTVMAFVERRAVPLVDHTLVVVEESARRLKAQLGIPEMRISVVGNTPRLASLHSDAAPPRRDAQSCLRLIYTGFVQEARGLEDVVEALGILRARGLDMKFRVVGDGPYLPRLAKLVKEKDLQSAVEFTGWVAHEDLATYVHEADVGVIPHPKNDHTDTTVPNKLFDYMACGRPVVVSNAAPLERIVTDERCGLVYKAGSPESLAAVLAQMSDDRAALERLGRSGAEAVRQRFHWERDAAALAEAVARVAKSGRGEAPIPTPQ